MLPQFSVLGRPISLYALTALVGAFLSGFLFCRCVRKRGLDDNKAIAVLLFAALGVFLGGHLLFGLTNLRLFPLLLKSESVFAWVQNAGLLFSGSVFYGGLFGGLAAGILAVNAMRLDLTTYADCAAPVIPLFHGVARIGCFFGGCCYGVESAFGFTAHGNPFVPAVNDVSRFPVQLLESACNLILAAVLFRLWKRSAEKPALRGNLLPLYLLCYACIRFADEFLRGDALRGHIGALSTSQFISLFVFAGGLGAILLRVRKKKTPAADSI